MVKNVKLLLFVVAISFGAAAQELQHLTLQQAYDLSQKNYPVIKQKQLVTQTADISISNLQKNFLPQVTVSGQASYQSDVTKVNIPLPGLSIEPPSKDQYKLVTDVSQLLYDGGITKEQKKIQVLSATVENEKVEVELYKLKERINQVYLSILYLDQQLKQIDLVKTDIKTGIKKVEAQVQNGVAFRSSLAMLKAELLKTTQKEIEIQASKKGLMDVLSLFIGQPLTGTATLETPASPAIVLAQGITRAELNLFAAQSKLAEQQKKLITAKTLPKANLFAQAGYGRPALNLLKNDFAFYYISGVRFSWSLGNIYTKKKETEQVQLNKKIIEIQQETFLLNTNTQLKQQEAEISKLQQLLETDNEIIALRKTVTDAAKAQLENGVITANDYLKEVNAEDQARQSQIAHQVQLLQAQINYQTITGKQ